MYCSTSSLLSRSKFLHTCSSFATLVRPSLACHSANNNKNGALCTQHRHVHEQPFIELPPDLSKNEAYEVARDALLQLNIMIRRGIEPDVLMYTTLIATMGRAKLEWQAYKLFSRMIEQNLRPLPETYVALYEATSPKREKLRAHIQTKMEDAIEQLPEQLAQEQQARRKEEDRWCVLKFEEYMRGELPQLPVQEKVTLEEREKEAQSSTSLLNNVKEDKEVSDLYNNETPLSSPSESSSLENNTRKQVEPIATMRIRNPTDAWRVAEMAEEQREMQRHLAPACAREELRLSLSRLHEEELRIYLTIHKQLRHGNKEQLITRILKSVAEDKIRSMLARRAYYFRSVGDLLEADLELLKMSNNNQDSENGGNKNMHLEQENEVETKESEEVEESQENEYNDDDEEDETLSNAESKQIEPEVLYTPWGIIRKPRHNQSIQPFASLGTSSNSKRNMARLEKVRLVAEELLLIRHKAEVKELDELPESLLRRYAYQFQLHWRHKQPLSLHNAVEWHVIHFLPSHLEQKGQERGILSTSSSSSSSFSEGNFSASPTPAIRLQMEDEGMRRSMENYEAFRIIAQRTNNLQVVDHKEINAHLQNVERQKLQSEQHAADAMRREQNILNAASLAQSARSYTPPRCYALHEMNEGNNNNNYDNSVIGNQSDNNSDNFKEIMSDEPLSHVLGIEPIYEKTENNKNEEEHSNKKNNDKLTLSENVNLSEESIEHEEYVNELPPWAMFGSEDEFNLTTGRFGDPSLGRYRELSDSNLRILPSQMAQQQWRVDRQLLPSSMRDVVHELELVQQKKRDAIEAEYSAKLQYNKYRKWDKLIQRASEKKAKLKEEEASDNNVSRDNSSNNKFASKPLPTKRRHAQLLRAGAERQRMSTRDIAKYNKSL